MKRCRVGQIAFWVGPRFISFRGDLPSQALEYESHYQRGWVRWVSFLVGGPCARTPIGSVS